MPDVKYLSVVKHLKTQDFDPNAWKNCSLLVGRYWVCYHGLPRNKFLKCIGRLKTTYVLYLIGFF